MVESYFCSACTFIECLVITEGILKGYCNFVEWGWCYDQDTRTSHVVPVSYPEILIHIVLCRFSFELFQTTCKKVFELKNLTFKIKLVTTWLVAVKRHKKNIFLCFVSLQTYKMFMRSYRSVSSSCDDKICRLVYTLGFKYFKSRLWTRKSGEKVQITINKEITEQNRTNVWVTLYEQNSILLDLVNLLNRTWQTYQMV